MSCSDDSDVEMTHDAPTTISSSPSSTVWSIRDKGYVKGLIAAHTTPTHTHGMPTALVDTIMSFFGHISIGSRVDVQDQIGKYVHGEIIDVSETADVKLTDVQISANCLACGALSSIDSDRCSLCGKALDSSSSSRAQDSPMADSDYPPSRPTRSDLAGTKVKIAFFGWDSEFDEWVTLDRVHPGGTKLMSTWLKRGAVVCLGQKDLKKMTPSHMLMARVVDLRPSTTSVLEVKVQVDDSIPFSFRVPGRKRQATKEEIEGTWVGLSDGRILQSGSFNTCVIA
jgi:hypothetical protein